MNGTYEYNKKTYSVITLRINRNKDQNMIDFLNHQESVNGYLLNLIRHDMMQKQTDGQYEVIEDRGIQKDILASFPDLRSAVDFVLLYVAGFDVGGRVYIAERFTGKINDADISAGIVQNIQKEEE